MKKFIFTIAFFALLFSNYAFAQEEERCKTQSANELLPKDLLPGGALFEKKILELADNAEMRTQQIYRIPVVVHVIHNGEPVGTGTNISFAQIKSQIDVLNEDFNRRNADSSKVQTQFIPVAGRINIEFVLANFDPEGTPLIAEPGVNRVRGARVQWANDRQFDAEVKPITIWDPKRYLNIWVASFSGGLLGYAVFPTLSALDGIPNEISPENRDGVVIAFDVFGSKTKFNAPQLVKPAFDRGRTATHEIGHFLGLLHTWGDGNCSVDDFCTDTPNAGGPVTGCKKGSISCTEIDMVENYLTYSHDSCMNIFTKQQVERMRRVLENSPRRKELLTSSAADPLDQNIYARFTANRRTVCAGQTVNFRENAILLGNAAVRSRQWFFEGGTPSSSTEQNPVVRYDAPGKYKVTLTVRDVVDESTLTREDFITVVGATASGNFTFKNFEDNILTSGGWTAEEGWATARFSALDTGIYSAVFDNYTQNLRGFPRRLSSPYINTGDADFLELSFDVAYALRSNNNRDSLRVSYSTDCGGTTTTIWLKGGAEIAGANTDTPYRPRGTEWRRERAFIDVRSLKNEKLVLYFDNIGNYGNALYLDNIFMRRVNVEKAPAANFIADRTLLLPGENAVFYDRSEFDPAGHLWSFGAANPETSKSLRPTVIFPAIGNYDISLTVSNPKGNNTARKNAYIRVSNFRTVKNTGNDLRLPQDASGNITGTNTRNDRAKAEFYGAITPLNELLGVEVQFAQLQASDPNAELTFALYQGETPAAALVSKKVKVRDLLLQGNNVRVAFDAPQKPTGAFFLSVEWENNVQIGIFASTKTPGSAWEKTSGGTWQPLSKPTSEGGRGQNLALAIYPLVTPGDAPTAINDEHLASKISVFPNPTKGLISVRTEDIHLTNVSVYDPTGRLLIEKTVQGNDFSFDVSTFSQGIFLLKIETENGVAVKKVIVEK